MGLESMGVWLFIGKYRGVFFFYYLNEIIQKSVPMLVINPLSFPVEAFWPFVCFVLRLVTVWVEGKDAARFCRGIIVLQLLRLDAIG